MQKVKSILPSWDKTKTNSKKGFDKAWGWADKLGAPVNRLSNKIGSEAFWPTSLDKECDKAARILRSFCKDGFYAQADRSLGQEAHGPAANTKQRVLKKIPQKVIENAVGLAIFTTMRSGLWISGAGGSGILMARMDNGEWSPPSGILLHTAALGFLVGVDIYDCVLVINNKKALDSFKSMRATLGGEISAVAGPVGVGGILENDGKWKQMNKPVFTYLKSRGFFAGVQVDGTIIIERTDENERFYGERIGVSDILAGKARHPPADIKMLMETVKAAEGRSDVDRDLMDELDGQPAPGDVNVDAPVKAYEPGFGIPEPEDPDPFGVLALEKAGMEIREAGTRSRPPSSQFEYRPSPTSPAYTTFHRKSIDTVTSKNGRESYMSGKSHKSRSSIDRSTQTTEMGTQTDIDTEVTTPKSSRSIENGQMSPRSPIPMIKEEEHRNFDEPEEIDYTKIDLGPYSNLDHSNSSQEFHGSGTTANSNSHSLDSEKEKVKDDGEDLSDLEDGSDFDDDEEPVVFEAASAQTGRLTPAIQVMQARGSVITVNGPKRIAPALPPRSPMRSSKLMDGSSRSSSPTKDGFEDVDLHATRSASPKMPPIERRSSSLRNEVRPENETTEETEAAQKNVSIPIVMEDLERTESAVGDLHLADIEGTDTTPNEVADLEATPAFEKQENVHSHEEQIVQEKHDELEKKAIIDPMAVEAVVDKKETSKAMPGGFDSMPPTPGSTSSMEVNHWA